MGDWLNPATLAIAMILATGGAAVWVAMYRDVIWAAPVPPTRQGPRSPGRSRQAAAAAAKQAETPPKQAATVSLPVSGIATPSNEAETISLRVVAKLVKAGALTQTAALEAVFDVRAGSSKRYVALVERYKIVAAELDQTEATPEQTATKS